MALCGHPNPLRVAAFAIALWLGTGGGSGGVVWRARRRAYLELPGARPGSGQGMVAVWEVALTDPQGPSCELCTAQPLAV